MKRETKLWFRKKALMALRAAIWHVDEWIQGFSMIDTVEVLQKIYAHLRGDIDLPSFREWMVGAQLALESQKDSRAHKLVWQLEIFYAEHSDGLADEALWRKSLAYLADQERQKGMAPMKTVLLSLVLFAMGGFLGAAITLHIVTNQVQARNAQISAASDDANKERTAAEREVVEAAHALIDHWQKRAEICEAKFTVGTIVYQNQDVASIPLMHGSVALTIGGAQGASRPSLYIPAQVDIYTNRLDVRYEWIDGRTGASKGVQIARRPNEVK